MPETMKLLGSTKSKIDKDRSGGNAPHLKITEVVLIILLISIILILLTAIITNIQESCIHLFLIDHLVNY